MAADLADRHPRAYIEMILSSKSGDLRWYSAISFGWNAPARSRGTNNVIFEVPVRTDFFD